MDRCFQQSWVQERLKDQTRGEHGWLGHQESALCRGIQVVPWEHQPGRPGTVENSKQPVQDPHDSAGGKCPQERGGRPHCLVFSELLPRCGAHFQTALQPSRRERCSPGPLRKQGHGGGGAGGGASCAPAPSPQPLPASGSPAAWLTAQRSALCQTTRPSCKTGALHPSFYSADREQTKPKDTPSHDSRACGDTDHTHVPSWQRRRKTVPHEGQPVPTSSRCYCF